MSKVIRIPAKNPMGLKVLRVNDILHCHAKAEASRAKMTLEQWVSNAISRALMEAEAERATEEEQTLVEVDPTDVLNTASEMDG